MNYVIQVMTPTNAAPVRCNCRCRLNSADRDNEQCRQPGEGLCRKSLNNIAEANITPSRDGVDPNGSFHNSGARWLEITPRLISLIALTQAIYVNFGNYFRNANQLRRARTGFTAARLSGLGQNGEIHADPRRL